MMDLLEYAEAKAARDDALAQVSDNAGPSFITLALREIGQMKADQFTGEDIRLHCQSRGLEGHHPNIWGSVIRTAITRGIIKHTGQWGHMKQKRSHARLTPIYSRGQQ